MSIFVILPQNEPAQLALPAVIERAFPNAHRRLPNHVWLVAGKGSAQDISNQLGITAKDGPGTAVVFEVASYYGRASKDIWDWVKAKWEATDG